MKKFKQFLDEKGRCWPGHKPVPGKKPYSPGSCVKEDHVEKLEAGLKKLDSTDYDTIDRLMKKISKDHEVSPKKLHNDFKSKHGKTPDEWIESKKESEIKEDLRKWFAQKWVRMDTKGNIKGDCARDPGEGKPKCLPQSKAHALGKEGRASAARRKRREDPNPERKGSPINVRTESAAAAIAAATAIAKKKSGNYDSEGFRKTPYKSPNHPLRKSNDERKKEMDKKK
jgi:hypothetical protein